MAEKTMTKSEWKKSFLLHAIASQLPKQGLKRIANCSFYVNPPSDTVIYGELLEIFERAARSSLSDHFSLTWGGCWAAECDMTFYFDSLRVDIGWSSTHRTALQAQAAVNLYSRVTEFAVNIQTLMDDLKNNKAYQEAPEKL